MSDNTKYMGLDYGEKRVGISVSDENKKYSFNREFVLNDKNLFTNILDIIRSEKISRIIIGLPVSLKNEKTVQTLMSEKFSEKLNDHLISNNIAAEIIFYDERLTSRIAEESLMLTGIKKRKRKVKGLIDGISAQIILQDYLDSAKNTGSS
ncbi:MAG: Holliday junction resolvase RuvX [Bacteroidetes bacterium]|nr:Holliday junction resolvase RuvX [Bacteroidota bacterium]